MPEHEWPELPYEAWKDTLATLHMKLQIVGKLRLALSPSETQWAHVALYLTSRGLTTGPMSSSGLIFGVDADLVAHRVVITTAAGEMRQVALAARSVAAFYREFTTALEGLGVHATIHPVPDEVRDPIPFAEDTVHSAYDPEWANRFFQVLARADLVLKEHRSRFRGRTSPVHFFWGSFDLANTRYSGRPAEPPPGADLIARKSEDAEQICAGFWPGGETFPEPAFYSYTYPKPGGIEEQRIEPSNASWEPKLGEFALLYDDVRKAASPKDAILEFCESTYAAGARLGGWDPGLVAERSA
jgi:Family of unknown function (DUF5996)